MQVTIGSTASSVVELMVSGGVGIVWSMAWTWLSSLARWSTATKRAKGRIVRTEMDGKPKEAGGEPPGFSRLVT